MRIEINVFNLGIWDAECDVTYSIGKSQSTIGDGEAKGHVVPLDHVLRGERVSFIKMDIEGAEPNALRGAKNIIADPEAPACHMRLSPPETSVGNSCSTSAN